MIVRPTVSIIAAAAFGVAVFTVPLGGQDVPVESKSPGAVQEPSPGNPALGEDTLRLTAEAAEAFSRGDDREARARVGQAVRAHVAQRRATDQTRRSDEAKDLRACFELASMIEDQARGPVLLQVIVELENRLVAAQATVKGKREKARMASNVGMAFERMAGDPVAARRLYTRALAIEPADKVALEGLARLDRGEIIDENKEIEVARLKELEAAWERVPRSRPPARSPFPQTDASTVANP